MIDAMCPRYCAGAGRSSRMAASPICRATDRDLEPLLKALVYEPLKALDQYQDHNVIEYAELSPPKQPARS
jgi:hypothetical protein